MGYHLSASSVKEPVAFTTFTTKYPRKKKKKGELCYSGLNLYICIVELSISRFLSGNLKLTSLVLTRNSLREEC